MLPLQLLGRRNGLAWLGAMGTGSQCQTCECQYVKYGFTHGHQFFHKNMKKSAFTTDFFSNLRPNLQKRKTL